MYSPLRAAAGFELIEIYPPDLLYNLVWLCYYNLLKTLQYFFVL